MNSSEGGGGSRVDLSRQSADVQDIRGVCGVDQHIGPQVLAHNVHQVLQVGAVRLPAEAVLVLDLRRAALV